MWEVKVCCPKEKKLDGRIWPEEAERSENVVLMHLVSRTFAKMVWLK